MAESLFDTIMTDSAIPAIEAVFGIAATHTNADSDELAVTVMLQRELLPTGEFGERMEERMTLELAKSHGAAIGDTFSVDNDVTTDDPDPDPTIWQATQLLTDDGYLQKFAVIEAT
jgi:hypothetical protein